MYIFGYGSLINEASRQLTGETGNAIPAIVSGLERHWGKTGSPVMSHLVVREGAGLCNGVLIHVNDDLLEVFDIREAGYQRVKLDAEKIKILDETIQLDGPVFVYVTDDVVSPCHVQPIAQSYVDTVLAGCLRYSAEFAQSFIQSTHGWDYPRMNDRDKPVYQRVAGVRKEDRARIDQFLHCIPPCFD
ncbi:gamma-glutamylcyclotransferase family protein [Enterovibrio nigricans]|uniref:Gamma-glutamyl cyclotransferase, AIG2-like n=1 Tax=Enterovibrio nigricans DSM 22720 TaxID=1121868 RepID=A0A1T4V5K7_9GAMM|nr:gamma-glutamylcyclotransferase family protein [Enterovibrio nigricans]PKF49868.1 gamma-glutamylcyclotransferase [Enterovibrio nigricans]SKA60255.1 Gamma-glutamyl cyclotransferase, AIG2-like [Enterovibrio nigricans DSM 22720]